MYSYLRITEELYKITDLDPIFRYTKSETQGKVIRNLLLM